MRLANILEASRSFLKHTVNLGYNELGYKESSAIRNRFELPESFLSLFLVSIWKNTDITNSVIANPPFPGPDSPYCIKIPTVITNSRLKARILHSKSSSIITTSVSSKQIVWHVIIVKKNTQHCYLLVCTWKLTGSRSDAKLLGKRIRIVAVRHFTCIYGKKKSRKITDDHLGRWLLKIRH